jgi:hypothetical protein
VFFFGQVVDKSGVVFCLLDIALDNTAFQINWFHCDHLPERLVSFLTKSSIYLKFPTRVTITLSSEYMAIERD